MMIDPGHKRLSIVRQCELVSISRASFYRPPAGESPENLALMRLIDEAFLECPFYGARQMARHLRRLGWCIGRKRVRRLMRKIGLSPIYQAPKTSEPHPQHKVYPYLLRHLAIERPNQVWCADVTYIPMRRGFLYLVAIMDWFSRKVLAWRLSNTMEADFCVAALEEAIAGYGRPDIFNSDQGSPFTGFAFTTTLKDAGIRISMDGRGRWMDNVFIERLWRSLKYECVFLNAFETGSEARAGIGRWIGYYNTSRPHSALSGRTPDEVYASDSEQEKLAAQSNPESTLAKPPSCLKKRTHLCLREEIQLQENQFRCVLGNHTLHVGAKLQQYRKSERFLEAWLHGCKRARSRYAGTQHPIKFDRIRGDLRPRAGGRKRNPTFRALSRLAHRCLQQSLACQITLRHNNVVDSELLLKLPKGRRVACENPAVILQGEDCKTRIPCMAIRHCGEVARANSINKVFGAKSILNEYNNMASGSEGSNM
jgi:putative transposase